ncbi:MAG: hypothetical protein KVP17_004465 [Porospora cf. gigantea B]|uniref:uncharacterized protein n=1 Tax=Porospora cf. gigantea B TaxID=2853592 RepID=UPI00357190ED|nr:MAG: hypothetical protein KVP17_004465 [Porospora cf. gigantea B]
MLLGKHLESEFSHLLLASAVNVLSSVYKLKVLPKPSKDFQLLMYLSPDESVAEDVAAAFQQDVARLGGISQNKDKLALRDRNTPILFSEDSSRPDSKYIHSVEDGKICYVNDLELIGEHAAAEIHHDFHVSLNPFLSKFVAPVEPFDRSSTSAFHIPFPTVTGVRMSESQIRLMEPSGSTSNLKSLSFTRLDVGRPPWLNQYGSCDPHMNIRLPLMVWFLSKDKKRQKVEQTVFAVVGMFTYLVTSEGQFFQTCDVASASPSFAEAYPVLFSLWSRAENNSLAHAFDKQVCVHDGSKLGQALGKSMRQVLEAQKTPPVDVQSSLHRVCGGASPTYSWSRSGEYWVAHLPFDRLRDIKEPTAPFRSDIKLQPTLIPFGHAIDGKSGFDSLTLSPVLIDSSRETEEPLKEALDILMLPRSANAVASAELYSDEFISTFQLQQKAVEFLLLLFSNNLGFDGMLTTGMTFVKLSLILCHPLLSFKPRTSDFDRELAVLVGKCATELWKTHSTVATFDSDTRPKVTIGCVETTLAIPDMWKRLSPMVFDQMEQETSVSRSLLSVVDKRDLLSQNLVRISEEISKASGQLGGFRVTESSAASESAPSWCDKCRKTTTVGVGSLMIEALKDGASLLDNAVVGLTKSVAENDMFNSMTFGNPALDVTIAISDQTRRQNFRIRNWLTISRLAQNFTVKLVLLPSGPGFNKTTVLLGKALYNLHDASDKEYQAYTDLLPTLRQRQAKAKPVNL